MQVVYGAAGGPRLARCTVVAGAFDGVHVGHQALLSRARSTAARLGGPLVAALAAPVCSAGWLTDPEHRIELLARAGVELCVRVGSGELQDGAAAAAARWRLLERLGAGALVTARRSSPEPAAPAGRPGFEVEVIDPVRMEGEVVSSGLVRQAVAAGAMERAGRLLGRPHELRGEVVHGDERGRSLGFPTANVSAPAGMAMPPSGVYAGWCALHSGEVHLAAVNVGRRPTFHDRGELVVEAHLLDFCGDLYGARVAVRFAHRLREELRFEAAEPLVEQMHRDVELTRRLLASR